MAGPKKMARSDPKPNRPSKAAARSPTAPKTSRIMGNPAPTMTPPMRAPLTRPTPITATSSTKARLAKTVKSSALTPPELEATSSTPPIPAMADDRAKTDILSRTAFRPSVAAAAGLSRMAASLRP